MDTHETLAAFHAAGLQIKCKVMPNGEQRYSVTMPDGTGWTLTIAGETGTWQNAHFHKGITEHYVVVQGCMIFAWQRPAGAYQVGKFSQNGQVTAQPNQPHNVLLLPGAMVHTLKYGVPEGNPACKGNDWYEAPDLDVRTKALGAAELACRYGIHLEM